MERKKIICSEWQGEELNMSSGEGEEVNVVGGRVGKKADGGGGGQEGQGGREWWEWVEGEGEGREEQE